MIEDKSIFIGYLYVLGIPEVLSKLSPQEQDLARKSIMGCLHKIVEYLKEQGDRDSLRLLELINHREKLNGVLPFADHSLYTATQECAGAVWTYFKGL
jgi:hypothetical protein